MAFQFKTRRAATEIYQDDQDPTLYRSTFYQGRQWVEDEQGHYVTWVEQKRGQNLEVRSSSFSVQSDAALARFNILNPQNHVDVWATKQPSIQVLRGAQWVDTSLVFDSYQTEQSLADRGEWKWRFVGVDGVMLATFDVWPGRSKWTYQFTASRAGTYRFVMEVRPQMPYTFFASYETKQTSSPYHVTWRFGTQKDSVSWSWRDWIDQGAVESADIQSKAVYIRGTPQVLAIGDEFLVDPSFNSDAAWGADCTESTKFPNDGEDWAGNVGGDPYRVANRFDITTLGTSDTVSQVDFDCEVLNITGGGSSTWIIGPYAGTGQGDPETDAVGDMFSNCDVSSDNYVTGITDFRTTGSKSFTDLGSTANTDMENARDAGTTFTLSIKMTTETSGNYTYLAEYTHATVGFRPTLTVTHSSSLVYEQEGFRWRNDDGTETTATWAAAQDVNTGVTVAAGANIRLRVLVNATGDPPSQGYELQFKLKDGPDVWRKVST
jgi:hypothetical protein